MFKVIESPRGDLFDVFFDDKRLFILTKEEIEELTRVLQELKL